MHHSLPLIGLPWTEDKKNIEKFFKTHYSASAVVLTLHDPDNRRPSILYSHGCSVPALRSQLDAVSPTEAVAKVKPKNYRLTVEASHRLESTDDCHYQLIVAGPKPYEVHHDRNLELLLQSWLARFNFPCFDRDAVTIIRHGKTAQPNAAAASMSSNLDFVITSDALGLLGILAKERLTPVSELEAVVTLADGDYWVNSKPLSVDATLVEFHPLHNETIKAVMQVSDPHIAEAVGILHKVYPDIPSLNELAKQVHMSPFHFHRLFHTQTGTTAKQYCMGLQMMKAKHALRTMPLKPVAEIAKEHGFSSHGHFTSAFHEIVGATPTDYRLTHAAR